MMINGGSEHGTFINSTIIWITVPEFQNRLHSGQSKTMADRERPQAPGGSERCLQSWGQSGPEDSQGHPVMKRQSSRRIAGCFHDSRDTRNLCAGSSPSDDNRTRDHARTTATLQHRRSLRLIHLGPAVNTTVPWRLILKLAWLGLKPSQSNWLLDDCTSPSSSSLFCQPELNLIMQSHNDDIVLQHHSHKQGNAIPGITLTNK